MKVKYKLTQMIKTYEIGSRAAYGIAAYQNCSKGATEIPIVSVNDITSNKTALAELVRLCNNLNLSAVHLHDVIEDFLAD